MNIEIVVKFGGALLAHPDHFQTALDAIAAAAAAGRRLLIVPGGGPFADVVREVDRRLGLSDAAAHWMAVLAMDQYAHLVAERVAGGALVADPAEIAVASRAGRLPVLAPFRWLRAADPVPHSWDVTGDSIAAWVTGQVGARHLVLVKPPRAAGAGLVDSRFHEQLPAGVTAVVLPADQLGRRGLRLPPTEEVPAPPRTTMLPPADARRRLALLRRRHEGGSQ